MCLSPAWRRGQARRQAGDRHGLVPCLSPALTVDGEMDKKLINWLIVASRGWSLLLQFEVYLFRNYWQEYQSSVSGPYLRGGGVTGSNSPQKWYWKKLYIHMLKNIENGWYLSINQNKTHPNPLRKKNPVGLFRRPCYIIRISFDKQYSYIISVGQNYIFKIVFLFWK
jgi:hypothetical protein